MPSVALLRTKFAIHFAYGDMRIATMEISNPLKLSLCVHWDEVKEVCENRQQEIDVCRRISCSNALRMLWIYDICGRQNVRNIRYGIALRHKILFQQYGGDIVENVLYCSQRLNVLSLVDFVVKTILRTQSLFSTLVVSHPL